MFHLYKFETGFENPEVVNAWVPFHSFDERQLREIRGEPVCKLFDQSMSGSISSNSKGTVDEAGGRAENMLVRYIPPELPVLGSDVGCLSSRGRLGLRRVFQAYTSTRKSVFVVEFPPWDQKQAENAIDILEELGYHANIQDIIFNKEINGYIYHGYQYCDVDVIEYLRSKSYVADPQCPALLKNVLKETFEAFKHVHDHGIGKL